MKTYHVKVRGVPDERIIGKLERGITIEGKRTVPCEIERMKTTGRGEDEGNSWYEVKLREGRNQQIRKMFKAVGHPVSKLRRVAIGPISDPHLSAGDWRELTPREVKMLATMQEAPKPKPRRIPAARPSAAKKKSPPAKKAAAATKRGAKAGSARKTQAGPRKNAAAPRKSAASSTPRKTAAGARRGRG